jgi:hypothetical protein
LERGLQGARGEVAGPHLESVLKGEGWFASARLELAAADGDEIQRLAQALKAGAVALGYIGEPVNAHWMCFGAWAQARFWALAPESPGVTPVRSYSAAALVQALHGRAVFLLTPFQWKTAYEEWLPHRAHLMGVGPCTEGDALDRMSAAAMMRAADGPSAAMEARVRLRGGAEVLLAPAGSGLGAPAVRIEGTSGPEQLLVVTEPASHSTLPDALGRVPTLVVRTRWVSALKG